MVRLLALVQKGPDISPGQRFRLEQWAPHLARDHGIELVFEAFESDELTRIIYRRGHTVRKVRLVLANAVRRWGARKRAAHYDGVIVYREAMLVGGAWLESQLTARGIPWILDFDDAIWAWRTSSSPNGLMSLAKAPWKVPRLCRLASAVTVGNEYLASYARRHNENVFIVRTSIDTERYPCSPPPPADAPFTVLWTGTQSTMPHLESIRPALVALGARVRTRLRVVCDVAPSPFPGLEVEYVRWSPATEAVDLAPAHVGIMPLPDTEFTRGKCGAKAIQCMAIGRPVVLTPIGINQDIVRDGVNGLWASTQQEWAAQLERLARDPALRARLGAAARETVVRGYTAQASAAAFARVVGRVIARLSSASSAAGSS
ncbi:MAG: glycosyltransferase [Gemmatimonadaceae bacterium]